MKLSKYLCATAAGVFSTISLAIADDTANNSGLSADSSHHSHHDSNSSDYDENPYYHAMEFSVDGFASGSLSEQGIRNLSGSRIRHDGKFGVGAGANWFFCRYLGVGGDLWSENTDRQFIDNASGNLIARYPIAHTGVAPYIFGGAGHQFDEVSQTFGQAGAGVEFRFAHHIGIFVDARYIFPDESDNFALGRAGFRFTF